MAAEQPEEKKEPEEGEEKKLEEKKEPEPEDEEAKIDFEGLDLFGVDEVKDIGAGVPLFKEFQMEDWTVMGLAFELHLMAHAFGKDVNDPERQGMHLDHLQFYYQKYFKKPLNLQLFGVSSVKELLALGMLRDVVYTSKQGVLRSAMDEEMESFQEPARASVSIEPRHRWAGGGGGGGAHRLDGGSRIRRRGRQSLQIFVKLAEASRRYRNIRTDFGDESEVLKLQVASAAPQWTGHQRAVQPQVAWQAPAQGTWQQQQSKPWQSGYGKGQAQGDWQQGGYGKAQAGKGKINTGQPGQPYNQNWTRPDGKVCFAFQKGQCHREFCKYPHILTGS
ncbi:unnamed protein product [Prorocentrum cordatum]|uniref:C3H1-type domain-containing protein n=1 Tax=Prorocentrum cordatum TaxID=2364126 RepID=A0ABN9UUR0_9DINO|nr:unnamed protein product [Polarella glacialis]